VEKPICLITGTTEGVGNFTALQLAKRGFTASGYLLVFEEELKKAKDPDSLVNTMKERFPSAEFVLAIERGAKANVKP